MRIARVFASWGRGSAAAERLGGGCAVVVPGSSDLAETNARRNCLASGVAVALLVVATPAQARHRHAARVVPSEVPPSADAMQLSGIAPPTRLGTAEQTYGDAVYARARAQSRYAREAAVDARAAATVGAPYPCDPRVATADAYVCTNDPHVLGYGQGYAFTPSYVSAPTVFRQDPAAQTAIMPEITGLFWGVNSARVDPH